MRARISNMHSREKNQMSAGAVEICGALAHTAVVAELTDDIV